LKIIRLFALAVTSILFHSQLIVGSTPPQTASSDSNRLDGFTSAAKAVELEWEERFRNLPSPDSAREHLRRLTAEPHVAGTKEDYATAIYVRDQFRRYGLSAEIKEYQVWLPYPRSPSVVEMISPRKLVLNVREAVVSEDPSSSSTKIISLFNGYSASGDVTAPLVYANFGLPDDYAELKKLGVDVKGKIVIVRYGNSFRGVKAKVAEDNGAIGCLIYSDPAEDGYMQGDVYPKGPWRPIASGQRGSVQYHFYHPGDPLTPNKPSLPGIPRLRIEEVTNLTHIPVQPLAYDDARSLIEPLMGPVRPRGFQGGLPFAYHVGGTDEVKVHLKTDMDYQQRSIWNVIARIDGAQEKDHWVIMGNHRDAWVFGAVDPNSGTTAMLEAARGLGALLKQGWKPRRTIVICSWDGEEYGLLGSTEWVEEYAEELRDKAIAYLNIDVAVAGSNFGASAVPSLWKLVRSATRDVKYPKSGKSVYQRWQDRAREQRSETEPESTSEAAIGSLGSGSDYTPFLQHLGIASTDMSFGGDYGVYHSAYDSFYWMSHFGDPAFVYHVAAAQLWGIVAMRLADAQGLAFDYTDYANQIREFFTESMRLARRYNLDRGVDEKSMDQALNEFSDAAVQIEQNKQRVLKDLQDGGAARSAAEASLQTINAALFTAERDFTDAQGLRGRAWYKHEIYAPGIYTGYAAQPLTDFRQALDDHNSANAREGLERIVQALKRATLTLRKAGDKQN